MRSRILLTLGLLAALVGATGPVFAQASKPTTPPPAAPAPAPAPATVLIDINSADKKTLMTLDGIADARSDAIIKGRPYRAKNELVDKKILTQAVYDKIKDQIIARQPTASPPPAKK
jgi:competence protein ComEA